MSIDLHLVAEFAKALEEARKQNDISDDALKNMHRLAKEIAEACETEAQKRGVDLDL
jgi:hypothetical protein